MTNSPSPVTNASSGRAGVARRDPTVPTGASEPPTSRRNLFPEPEDDLHDAPAVAAPTVSPPRTVPPWEALRALQLSVGGAVIGLEDVVHQLLTALISGGHVLLEGVPGLAKTYLVRSFSASLDLQFRRIQFTPDMLPTDILGTVMLSPTSREFEFRPGPIFANVVLADEINRAPPKVQSALLEAMQEQQVTVDGKTYPLPKPFIVIATQNPIEQEGTYPLPEAELDRFLFRVLLKYPEERGEYEMMRTRSTGEVHDPTDPVVSTADLDTYRSAVLRVYVADRVLRYMTSIVRGSRADPKVLIGASPRAGVHFLLAAKAVALLAGRSYVIPDDVKQVALPVFNHRLILRPEIVAQQSQLGILSGDAVLAETIRNLVNRFSAPR